MATSNPTTTTPAWLAAATAISGGVAPPPGVVPNFDQPRNCGRRILVIYTTSLVFFTAVFYTVLWARKLARQDRWVAADRMGGVAFMLAMSYYGTSIAGIQYGGMYFAWEITKAENEYVTKVLYTSSIIFTLADFATKTTLLLVFLEASALNKQQRQRLWLKISIICLSAAYMSVLFLKATFLNPLAGADPAIPWTMSQEMHDRQLADLLVGVGADITILITLFTVMCGFKWQLIRMPMICYFVIIGACLTNCIIIYRIMAIWELLKSDDMSAGSAKMDILLSAELAWGMAWAYIALFYLESLYLLRSPAPAGRHESRHMPSSSADIELEDRIGNNGSTGARPSTVAHG